jgi:2-phosphosulfolactate phosphatase
MSRPISVHLLPFLFNPADLREGVAVVMDVLRATSTIIQSLAAGAECVVPCSEIDEARRAADALPSGTAILGGERQGLKIPDFDLGNSPEEYTSGLISGKRVIFTTTNGTRALIRAREARRVLVAALSNLSAVVSVLAGETGPVHLVCAGTDGRLTLEDVLCAGGIARGLNPGVDRFVAADDSTYLAMNLYETCGRDYDCVLETLRLSRGGRNLIECGLESDIAWCAVQDRFKLVPELDRERWEIRVVNEAQPRISSPP